MDLRYITPPPSFVGGGQRIRTARQIGEERLATCLDLAVLFCSCLEAAGLRPLIVLQREHAFAGVWLSKGDFGASTVDDAPGLRTRLKLDDLKLFETTLVTPSPQARLPTGDAGRGSPCRAGEGGRVRGADRHPSSPPAAHPAARQRDDRLRVPARRQRAEADLPGIEDAPPLRDDVPPPRKRRLRRQRTGWRAGASGCWTSPAATGC